VPLPSSSAEALEQVRKLYERALAAGEDLPDDVMQWTADDLRRLGAWEYRVERLPAGSVSELDTTLNEWGQDRWEVFWMEREGDAYTVFLKRSARSYLRHVPVGDLLRWLPSTDAP